MYPHRYVQKGWSKYMVNVLKCLKRHIVINVSQNTLSCFRHIYSFGFATFWSSLGVLCFFMNCDQGHPMEKLIDRNIRVCLSSLVWHYATSNTSQKSKWQWKVNVLNWLRTWRWIPQYFYHSRRHSWKASRTASESGNKDG